jgi:4-hydroxybenzoyl-CoA reductase subunit beta
MTMRLPAFEYLTPATLADATRLLADPERSVVIAGGGTDLFPKMKRRQLTPATLVSLSEIAAMSGIRSDHGGHCIIGASTLLREVEASTVVPRVLAAAVGEIASPQIRNTATLGGNLCLDTRCNYIDMPPGWRDARGHCMKDGGEICWVAPNSDKCWAVSSSDLAPVAIALNGSVRIASVRGDRLIPVEDLYQNDGIAYQTKAPDEILVELVLPPENGRATYRKLRRRGSIDFPILGVAATARFGDDGTCLAARLVLGAVASAPLRATEAEQFIVGRRLTDEVMEEAGRLATQPFRPQNNTDMSSRYRKWMISVYVVRALRDLVVDDA